MELKQYNIIQGVVKSFLTEKTSFLTENSLKTKKAGISACFLLIFLFYYELQELPPHELLLQEDEEHEDELQELEELPLLQEEAPLS